jgi:hypothetical protein
MATKQPTIPAPVDSLKIALAFMAQGRIDEACRKLELSSTDKLRRYANFARTSSQKFCIFCGTHRTPKMNGKTGTWEGYALCACLDHLTKGYREHVAWQDLPALSARVASGSLDPDTIAYANDCGCTRRFTITVGQIVKAFERHGQARPATKCLVCVQNLRQKAAQKKQHAPSHARKDRPMHKHTHAGATALTTSIAEHMTAKGLPPEVAQA